MRLFTFEHHQRSRLGAESKGQLVDLRAAYASLQSRAANPGEPASLPGEMLAFLRAGEAAWTAAGKAIAFAGKRPALPVGQEIIFPRDAVHVLTPISRPGKILCAGLNCPGALKEKPGAQPRATPPIFCKFTSALTGPGAPIVLPRDARPIGFHAELAVIIGRQLKQVSEAEAMAGIAGFTILNNVSVRNEKFAAEQPIIGGNFDTFCPLGPCLVTPDEIGDPWKLRLRSLLNGTVLEEASMGDSSFPLGRLIEFLSRGITLEPGDVVSAPARAAGDAMARGSVFLQPGDTVAIEIDRIGRLENPVVGDRG